MITCKNIIEALQTVWYGGHSCEKCKYKVTKIEDGCGIKGCKIARNAIDFISSQQKKIDELENALKGGAE